MKATKQEHLFDKLVSLLKEEFCIHPDDDIKITSTMTDLGLDSIDLDSLVCIIEDEFDLPYKDSEVALPCGLSTTVQDLIEFIEKYHS